MISRWVTYTAPILALILALGCAARSEEDYTARINRYFEQNRFQKAVEECQAYLDAFPQGRLGDQMLFRKGEILYYALKQRGAAVKVFSQLVESYPESEYSLKAREILAPVFRDETRDYIRAILEYRWLLNHTHDLEKAAEYQYQIAHCYFLANRFEEAIRESRLLIDTFPDAETVEKAFDEVGDAYFVLGQPAKAIEAFEQAIERFPESPRRPVIEFKIAGCYEEMGRLKEALERYKSVRATYPNQPAVDIRIQGVEARLAGRGPLSPAAGVPVSKPRARSKTKR